MRWFRAPSVAGALATSVVLLATLPSAAQPIITCGNGYCDAWAGETPQTCPADCGKPPTPPPYVPPTIHHPPVRPVLPPATCGNGYCDGWAHETPENCPADCGKPATPPPAPAAETPHSRAQYFEPWQPGAPVPPGYHIVEVPKLGLLIGGSATLAAGYLFGVMVGSFNWSNGGAYTLIPVLGPFFATSTSKASPGDTAGGPYAVGLYLLGGMQILGGVMIGTSGLMRQPYLVHEAGLTIRPVPLSGKGMGGFGFEGTF